MTQTIQDALRAAAGLLRDISDAPEIDAERLLLHTLGQGNSSYFAAHGDTELSIDEQQHFDKLVRARATGRPLAYILGVWEFYGREFTVTEDVLIPRPETEVLVDAALARITRLHKELGRPLVVVDIGTGSGVVAITLLLESDIIARVIATDVSVAALQVARKNAAVHGLTDRIDFIQEDIAHTLGRDDIDLIVSNPPYVPSAEVDAADALPETTGLRFEPRGALDGGVDGLDFVKKIADSGLPAVVEGIGGEVVEF